MILWGSRQRRRKDVLTHGSLSATASILLVFVKGDHLAENLFGNLVDRGEVVRCDGYLHVLQAANDGLDSSVVNTVEWLDHHEFILLLRILHDCCFNRGEVLLVRQVDVIKKRTLTRQECAGQFQ